MKKKDRNFAGRALSAVAVCVWIAIFVGPVDARTFTATDGRTVEATVTKVTRTSVVLKLSDGRSATVPLDRLSKADQKYIQEWSKEEAKNRIPRVDVEINSNKRDSQEEAGYQDRIGSIRFEITIGNEERGFRIEKAKATLIVWGDEMDEDDTLLVMQRTDFKDIALDFGETYQLKAKEVRYEYDKVGYKHGVKYDGYLFVLYTAAGKVMNISGSSGRIEKLAEVILKLKEGEYCNERFEKLSGSSGNIIR